MMKVLQALASLKLTLVMLIWLGVSVTGAYLYTTWATWVLAGPLLLFAVNLSAALLTNPSFRKSPPLLWFHIVLIAIVLFIALGRLTYLKGTLELPNDTPFTGVLTSTDAGPLHNGRLSEVRFISEGFRIEYSPGLVRGDTYNPIQWIDENGQSQKFIARDYYPFVMHGYRFYPSHNKGFSPKFVWTPSGGQPIAGAINLPSYPLNEFKQALEWTPPGSVLKLWTQLQFNEVLLNPAEHTEFKLPKYHRMVVRYGGQRYEMAPGDQITLPGGVLQYQGLSSWMGYTVFYDWTASWLLALGVLAVLTLAGHFWRKFSLRPWQAD